MANPASAAGRPNPERTRQPRRGHGGRLCPRAATPVQCSRWPLERLSSDRAPVDCGAQNDFVVTDEKAQRCSTDTVEPTTQSQVQNRAKRALNCRSYRIGPLGEHARAKRLSVVRFAPFSTLPHSEGHRRSTRDSRPWPHRRCFGHLTRGLQATASRRDRPPASGGAHARFDDRGVRDITLGMPRI